MWYILEIYLQDMCEFGLQQEGQSLVNSERQSDGYMHQ